ncbi:VanZ family protein [Floccifex sp.]|uniref:VanZ family protein n=1 Tax=Floccifex sp. TaxID=2815810 RepID=UPI003EFF735D
MLATFVWMGFIFYMSSQASVQSTNQSMYFVSIFNYLFHIENVEWLHVFIRKSAHMFEYFVLGILVYQSNTSENRKWTLFAFIICLFYASSDEFHQLFVSMRNGSILDICLDSFSSLLGIGICKFLKF